MSNPSKQRSYSKEYESRRRQHAWDWSRWSRKPQAMEPNQVLEQTIPSHEMLLHPMGEPLLLQTNDPGLLEAARETIGRFQPRSNSGSPLVIRLYIHRVELPDPNQLDSQSIIFRTQGHLLYITTGAGNAVVADLISGQAFGFITPQMAADHAFVRYAFLEGLTYSLLCAGRGFIGFHAACISRAGQGFILCGEAGAGKSTMAYACARRGYQILAEDGLLLQVNDYGSLLWGMPWKIHLLPDARQLFPELEHEAPHLQINGEWKLEVEVENYHPGAAATTAEPTAVVLLERGTGTGQSYAEMVTAGEARKCLQPIWPYWVGWHEEMDSAVIDLVEERTYRLRLNGTPDEGVDALDELLEGMR